MAEHLAPSNYTLRHLLEVPVPDAVSWWPQTFGWYYIMSVMLLVGVVLVGMWGRFWWHNRYRREALASLKKLRADDPKTGDRLYRLLKIVLTHLSDKNAATYGHAFLVRLDDYEPAGCYQDALGSAWLESLVNPKNVLSVDEVQQLLNRSDYWLRHHKEVKHV